MNPNFNGADTIEAERQYPDVVVFAVSFLLDKKLAQNAVTADEQEKAIIAAKALFPQVINGEREAWLKNDIAYLVEDFWDTLRAQNYGKRAETIRGALR